MQRARRLLHRNDIERTADMPDAALVERGGRAAAKDAVFVMPRRRRKARVKFSVRDRRRQHRDGIGPQMRVQCVADRVGGKILHEIEMRHLSARVHARIGAARARHRDALARLHGAEPFELLAVVLVA